MARYSDILYMTEYIHNVLYFATVRHGKSLHSNQDTYYFSIDNELIYDNYYADFGPLNLGCIYKYCKILNEKLRQYSNKHIVHYTSIDPKKKANAAFLLGCYGVLYLALSPKDALRPLLLHGQNYKHFQDATQGESCYTVSLIDCLLAIKKARDLGFYNFQDFNVEEYERLNKIQGGDLNWIIPGKYLAFIGPVDYTVSLYHPPELYLDYFLTNNIKMVIRLNKKMYNADVFTNVGILHIDLFFPDGSCPPRHILFKFLQISEDIEGGIAVHCKAGLGRTGTLIGCYLMKHYRMTAREAIAWMRICRPGSVIGHQQAWLEQIEPWLLKQGNLYRKRMYQDADKIPIHEYGVYSIAEILRKQPLSILNKSTSYEPVQIKREIRSDLGPTAKSTNTKRQNVSNKVIADKEREWRVKTLTTDKPQYIGNPAYIAQRPTRVNAAGEPRITRRPRSPTRSPSPVTKPPINKPDTNKIYRNNPYQNKVTEEKDRLLKSSIMVTPHTMFHTSPYTDKISPTLYNMDSRQQTTTRRRLGRSPSPPQSRNVVQTAPRTSSKTRPKEKYVIKEQSKTTLQEELSNLKWSAHRERCMRPRSIGAASLGARRDAPAQTPATSARSDERPLATQGDLLNSIKFQRTLRDSLYVGKASGTDRDTTRSRPTRTTLNPRPTARPISPKRTNRLGFY